MPLLSTRLFPGFISKIFRFWLGESVGGGRFGAIGAVLRQTLLEMFHALSQRLVLLFEKGVFGAQRITSSHHHFELGFKLHQSVVRVPHGHLIYACLLKNRALEKEISDFFSNNNYWGSIFKLS
jgi:hypothetical protein